MLGRSVFALAAALAIGSALGACGGQASTPTTLRVPGRYRSIQSAVNASAPGDTILIAPGVYHEAVTVGAGHRRITIRGQDRNSVILDGRSGKLVNGISVHANGVAVENLTIRRYAVNGLVFAPSAAAYGDPQEVTDWRGSYLTTYDNGLYGVYAFQARQGQFDHVYASGQPDSGIYVGQCNPCRATVSDSVALDNAVGYEDTNATGVTVRGVLMRANRIGALLDSDIKEQMAPQSQVVLENSTITANDNPRAPTGDQGFGAGVDIAGGDDNLIEHNTISGQPIGVLVANATADTGGYQATDNRVQTNRLSDRTLDLDLETGSMSQGNCFLGNHPARTFPPRLEQITICGRTVPLHGVSGPLPSNPPPVDYLSVPPPPALPSMP